MFIGRKKELDFLNEKYYSPKGELVVLYGRRRVGKTELLKEFCSDKPAVFYTCREYTDRMQLDSFFEKVRSYRIPSLAYTDGFPDWEKAFFSVCLLPTERKKVLIIDEFPYICKNNESIPSVLQVLWDEKLKDENVMIVLCGSAMSFMEKNILAEKSPLYGRATAVYKLLPLPYTDAVRFFPNYSAEEKLIAYSVLGGIPQYLQQFHPSLSLKENIIKNILRKGSALYSETEFMIRQELREPSVYNTIIEAVSQGCNSLNDIVGKTKIDRQKATVYLRNLIEIDIIEKELPVMCGETEKINANKGSYVLTDNFFRFWYAFCYRSLTDLERDDAEGVWEFDIEPFLHRFASKTFEKVCAEYLLTLNRHRKLPFRIGEIGRFWGKAKKNEDGKIVSVPIEIDVLATDKEKKNYLVGECKFKNEKFDNKDFLKLTEKMSFSGDVRYYLFSLSGFDNRLHECERKGECVLVTAEEILSTDD